MVRLLLLLYPPSFRRRFGGEMRAAYRDQLRSARLAGRRGVARLAVRTAAGMTRGAWAEWRGGRGPGDGGGGMKNWGGEIVQALRRLGRAPGFTAVTILTLAVGTGAFTAVWSVADGVLFEPMPYDAPERLVWVWRNYTWVDFPRGWLGGPDVVRLREQDDVFEGVVAARSARRNLAGGEGVEPRDIRVTLASANLFEILGRPPLLGRGFEEGEDAPGSPLTAILGHGLWSGAFGADPSVIGSTIYLDGNPATVVGVLPEGFDFVVHSSLGEPEPADLYLPLRVDLAAADPGSGFLAGLARIREGVGPARLEGALAQAARPVDEALGSRGLVLWAAPLKGDLVAGIRAPLLAVVGAAGFLLLTLAANLATLFLARGSARGRDIAVRAALGAGRPAIASTVLAEAAVLAAAGGALGIPLGAAGASLLARAAAPVLPRVTELGLDPGGALLALGLAGALALMASLVPVARALGSDVGHALREGGVRGGAGVTGGRGRGGLVIAQLALSMVLLVGAGLLGRSVGALLRVDPGFDPGATLTFRIALDAARYPEDEDVVAFHGRLRESLMALPGVVAVGLANALPLGLETDQTSVAFPGARGNTGDVDVDRPLVDVFVVDHDYRKAAGLRLLSGRDLEEGEDGGERPPAVLIDDVLARRFFPEGRAAGGRVALGNDTATIAGVVDQARFYDVRRDDRGQLYLPLAWRPTRGVRVAVRAAGDAAPLAEGARDAVGALDPRLPVSEVSTLAAAVRRSLGDQRMSLMLVGGFAAGALLLTCVGLYGVVAGTVVRRRGEIGVRMAMGADRGRVVAMVLGQGARFVVVGVGVGAAAAWVAARTMGSLLFGVSPFDPLTYAAVAVALAFVALLASWLPARTASRISPTEALRAE